jgi:hypothetical protein
LVCVALDLKAAGAESWVPVRHEFSVDGEILPVELLDFNPDNFGRDID